MKILIKDKKCTPTRATKGSVGYDLYAASEVTIQGHSTVAIPCGFHLVLPSKSWEAQVRPRSGLSLKTKLRVANSPGTIDSDYRGEVMVIMDNIGDEPVTISQYDRIAQMVVVHYPMSPELIPITNIDDHKTERGSGGFGSTGK